MEQHFFKEDRPVYSQAEMDLREKLLDSRASELKVSKEDLGLTDKGQSLFVRNNKQGYSVVGEYLWNVNHDKLTRVRYQVVGNTSHYCWCDSYEEALNKIVSNDDGVSINFSINKIFVVCEAPVVEKK